jgi:hypothetical protein
MFVLRVSQRERKRAQALPKAGKGRSSSIRTPNPQIDGINLNAGIDDSIG